MRTKAQYPKAMQEQKGKMAARDGIPFVMVGMIINHADAELLPTFNAARWVVWGMQRIRAHLASKEMYSAL
jgi:hypothetical protein